MALYERALEFLGQTSAGTGEERHEAALVWGNVSAAKLQLGDGKAALAAAMESARAEDVYAKAYFRQAKALLKLGQRHEAANAARVMLFLTGDLKEAQVLLAEADTSSNASAVVRPLVLRAPQASAAALEEEEVLMEVSRCCDGHALAHLGRCNLNLHAQVATEDAFLRQAAALCPQRSEHWLRRDLLDASGSGHGWLYAERRLAAVSAARNRLAICGSNGRVRVCDPDGEKAFVLPVPPECLPYSLCWSPGGEYVAYTATCDHPRPALVFAGCQPGGPMPIMVPLLPGLEPYFLAPSPCGTRVALLGSLGRRQALIVADTAQLLHPCRERAPPVTLLALGTAAPLYLDWAPDRPELLLFCEEQRLARIRADVLPERDYAASMLQLASQPSEPSCTGRFSPVATTSRQRVRAPQWLPWPGCPEGRWLVPYPHGDRTALALIPPLVVGEPREALRREDIVCENLPPIAPQFAASRSGNWVAWTGAFDMHGHEGVFVRKVPPDRHPPLRIFGSTALALTWGGDRLAFLVPGPSHFRHAPERLVWAAWDPPEDGQGPGLITVAEDAFVPHVTFLRRVLPFFDQFERTLHFWNPTHDAVVFTDSDENVWVQPFPWAAQRGRLCGGPPGVRHPLSGLLGAEDMTVVAPPAQRIGEGTFACWSPS